MSFLQKFMPFVAYDDVEEMKPLIGGELESGFHLSFKQQSPCRNQDPKELLNRSQLRSTPCFQKTLGWIILLAAIVLFCNHFSGSHVASTNVANEGSKSSSSKTSRDMAVGSLPPYVLSTKSNNSPKKWEAWAGDWELAYANGFQTEYSISPDGSIVASVDDGTNLTMHLSIDPNATNASFSQYIIEHGARGHEKVKLLGSGKMLLQQWVGNCQGDLGCRGVAIRKNGPVSDHSGFCLDDLNFVDELGSKCPAWRGYDCTAAHSVWSYSVKGKNDVLEKCAATCTVCDIMLAESMLQQWDSFSRNSKTRGIKELKDKEQ